MSKNGIVKSDILINLAMLASELMHDLAHKHEDGIFLHGILKDSPHSHRSIKLILDGYCKLINEIGFIFSVYEESKDNAEEMVENWKKKLHHHRSKETKLLLDTISIDIGGDH